MNLITEPSPDQPPLTARARWISLAELLVGTFVVIGHNVFRILPNEVPLLVVLFCLSILLRREQRSAAGFRSPKSWTKAMLLALAAAAVLQLGSELVVEPLIGHFFHAPENVSSVMKIPVHDWKVALRSLAIVWFFAALGEEIGYRGYLLNRAADLGNGSRIAYILAMLYIAVLFGLAHFYKGPAGVLDSAYSGIILGGVYLLGGRNLWIPILAHGFSDSFAVLAIFMGWAT